MTVTFIDLAFPYALQDGRFPLDVDGGLRWKLSTLIVAFPLFLFTFRVINKAVARDPTKRDSRPRKWLTCLTLFGAGVILSADVVALLYNLLGGELTIRFVLKVATVGILAGGIFAYFLPDIRQEDAA